MTDKHIIPFMLLIAGGVGTILYNNTITVAELSTHMKLQSEAMSAMSESLDHLTSRTYTRSEGEKLELRVTDIERGKYVVGTN